jgi:hypothetical protein
VGRVVSPVLPVHSPEEVGGSTPVETHKFYTTHEPTTGCHVAAHDWATWHLSNQSDSATCRALIRSTCLPRTLPPVTVPAQSLPADVIHATSACATCHPYSGDTCHPLTGPTVPVICPSPATCHHQKLPHQLYGRTACTVSLPRGTVRTVQSPIFFLPVWVFGQNAISFAYEARLTK